MSQKQGLDYLAIPYSKGFVKKQRRERAKEELKKRDVKKTVILRGKDSEEDILILGRILKKGDRVGIVTFPLHFREYQDIIKRAIKQGKFPAGAMIEGILTGQTGKEFVYGEFGLGEEKFFEKKVDLVKSRNNKTLDCVKRVLKKIIPLS